MALRASVILLLKIVAVIIDFIAVGIPYWYAKEKVHLGFWRICNETGCQEFDTVPDTWKYSRGIHTFAALVGAAALALYIVLEVCETIGPKRRRIFCASLNIVAGVMILIADCYMSTRIILHPAGISLSFIAATLFIYVGGNLSYKAEHSAEDAEK